MRGLVEARKGRLVIGTFGEDRRACGVRTEYEEDVEGLKEVVEYV